MGLGGMASSKNGGAGVTIVEEMAFSQNGTTAALVTGVTIDTAPPFPGPATIPGGVNGGQNGTGSAQHFLSATFGLAMAGNITAAQTMTLTLLVEHADLVNGAVGAFTSAPAAYQPLVPGLVIPGAGAYAQLVRYDLRTAGLKRFIRFKVTPLFSLVNASEMIVAGGFANLYGSSNLVTRTVDWTPTYTTA